MAVGLQKGEPLHAALQKKLTTHVFMFNMVVLSHSHDELKRRSKGRNRWDGEKDIDGWDGKKECREGSERRVFLWAG